MSVDYYLFRARRPLGKRRSLREGDLLSFGPAESVRARLPPSHAELDVGTGECTAIVARRAAPWDLLPVIAALSELAPFVIFDPQGATWHDPAEFADAGARAAPAIFAVPKSGAPRGLLDARWTATSTEELVSPRLLAFREGVVVSAGRVSCIDQGGHERWTVNPGRGEDARLLTPRLVLLGGEPGVTALSLDDGRTTWTTWSARVTSGPIVAGEDAVAIGTDDGRVLLLGHADGRIRWEARVPSRSDLRRGPPAIMGLASASGFVIASTNVGDACCIDERGVVVTSRHFPPIPVNPRTLQACALRVETLPGQRLAIERLGRDTRIVSLPDLEDVPGLPVLPESVSSVASGLLFGWEARSEELSGPNGLTLVKRGVLTRAHDASDLRVRFEYFDQVHTPTPPFPIEDDRFVRICDGRRSDTYRLAVVDADGRIIASTEERRRKWGIGLAASEDTIYLADDRALTALQAT